MHDSRGLVEVSLRLAHLWVLFRDIDQAKRHLESAGREIKDNQLTSFTGDLDFGQGLLLGICGKLESSIEAYEAARNRFAETSVDEKRWMSMLKIAECFLELGKAETARTEVTNVLSDVQASASPTIFAEANFLMGKMASALPEAGLELPIVYFRKGMNAIAQEPVGEITWKLSYALATEYRQRGQTSTAHQYFLKAKVVLDYFMSQITSPELRTRYLSAENRHLVLSTIDQLLQS